MRAKVEKRTICGTYPSKIEKLAERPKNFLIMTGFVVKEFYKLVDRTKDEAGRQDYKKHKQREMKRKYGAGRPHKLPFADRLCAALMVMNGVLKAAIAEIFDVSVDTIERVYNEIEPVLIKALKSPEKIYWHATHSRKNADIREWMNLEKVSTDAVVIETTKPRDKATILLYSRRGKGIGLNVLTSVDADGQVCRICPGEPASHHDAKVYGKYRNLNFSMLPDMLLTDRGLIGVEKDMRVNHVHGIKKRPGRELAEEDRKINSWINSQKYNVEQVNSFIQNFGILDTIKWKDKWKLYRIMQAIGALINFRLECRKDNPLDWGHKSRPLRKRAEKPDGFTIEEHMKRTRGKKQAKVLNAGERS